MPCFFFRCPIVQFPYLNIYERKTLEKRKSRNPAFGFTERKDVDNWVLQSRECAFAL